MSNDLILSIKNSLAHIKGGIDEDSRAVAGGSGGGGTKRISIKGGVFRKMVGGKEIGKIEDRHMNIIFVKMAHDPSRTYYESGYQEGAKAEAPVCWSSNSKTPDPEVKEPKASSCDQCQNSVKGSGQNGTGSACKIGWRTAIVLPNDPSGDVMQLFIPGKSCWGEEVEGKWPFRPYIQHLVSHTVSAGCVVTRMQFDTNSTMPKLLFSPAAVVSDEDIEIIKRQSKVPAAVNAVKLTVYQRDEGTAPAQPIGAALISGMTTHEAAEAMPEPVLKETKKTVSADETDVPDIIKKWSKKGK